MLISALGMDVIRDTTPVGDFIAAEGIPSGEEYAEAIVEKFKSQSEEILRQVQEIQQKEEEIKQYKLSKVEMLERIGVVDLTNQDKDNTIKDPSTMVIRDTTNQVALDKDLVEKSRAIHLELMKTRKMVLCCKSICYILGGSLAFMFLFAAWVICKWVGRTPIDDAE
jgi:hypothetical protein